MLLFLRLRVHSYTFSFDRTSPLALGPNRCHCFFKCYEHCDLTQIPDISFFSEIIVEHEVLSLFIFGDAWLLISLCVFSAAVICHKHSTIFERTFGLPLHILAIFAYFMLALLYTRAEKCIYISTTEMNNKTAIIEHHFEFWIYESAISI